MTAVRITSVEWDHEGRFPVGYYIDDDGTLRHTALTNGEASTMQRAFEDGARSVGYELTKEGDA